jgi:hypothetical protein
VGNLAAWLGGAVLAQGFILVVLSMTKPDPAYGIYGTLFFAGLFGLGAIFCGLIGYAVIATFLPSSAGAGRSTLAGAISAVLMIFATYMTGWLIPDSLRLAIAAAICVALGAASYAFANRERSDNRWSGRDGR